MLLLDTSVAIELLDEDEDVSRRFAESPLAAAISVVTRVELEGGVRRDPENQDRFRQRLDQLLDVVSEQPFRSVEAETYGRIVAALGYSRRQVIDRMIAATALTLDAVLVTRNPRDFRSVPGLRLEAW